MSLPARFESWRASARGGTVCLAVLWFGGAAARAQQSGGPAVPASPTPLPAAPLVNAPLEDRIAAARSVKVMTSILGIELGSELDEAHEKLDKLCASGTRPREEGEDHDAKEQNGKDQEPGEKNGGERERRERKPKPGEEEDEGHKVLWTLAGTDYSAVYITADDKERIDSITGYLRPDKQMAFEAVGEVAKAPVKDPHAVVWDVLRVGQPLFRVVARGTDGKANMVRLFVVRRKTGEVVPYVGGADDKPH